MQAHYTLAFVLSLYLGFIAVVSCYTPSHRSKKGFGKKASDDEKKKNLDEFGVGDPERRYLEPFGLEIDDNNEIVGDRIVQTLIDRAAGDVVLEIPLADTLTVDRIRARLASCGSNEHEINHHNQDEEEALALGLLRLRDEASDPYVTNVLPPKHFNVWTLPGDLWKETSKVLPRCYAESFGATRQRVNAFATQLAEATATSSNSRGFTLDDAKWAFSMVRSRSLAVPELNDDNVQDGRLPLALIPGLDLLNHAFGSGTQLQLVVDEKHGENSKWVVTSADSLEAGDEVCLSYGDDKDNWKLLLTYGFAVPENPNALVFWSWEDLLDAAREVRPGTFSDPVCRQLLRHPQLEAYTIASENRATFSFDAQKNAPRESLANGLVMLNSLAAQLGKPEPDIGVLDDQVLRALRRRRLEELMEGQSHLKDLRQAQEPRSEWKPFFESLSIALESEWRHLQRLQPTE